MKRIYVGGAYQSETVVGVLNNMRKGINLSFEILKLGFAPFCPWLDYHFGLMGELTDKEYKAYSMAWLEVSDAVLLVPDWENSSGVKAELERARQLAIPIVFSIDELWNLP